MLPVVVFWIWLCAYLNCAGWVLSACHGLNKAGYAVVFGVGLVAILVWRKKSGAPFFPPGMMARFRRHFRRPFPLAFLILAGMAFIGGALYLPSNYDALAYRTTRVLDWLDAGTWEWVHSDFPRLNTRTAGFEWVTAPLILFSGTDRLVFLINVISFVLLPGRVFAILTRLGVGPRAAWHWMWLFPTGYGYLTQAGSAVNDMFGAFVAFVAFEFALRASQERKVEYLWTSLVAAALMTSAKAYNILLLLPWILAAFPALLLLLRRPVCSIGVMIFAAGASLLPTAYENAGACGDWTGLKVEQPTVGGKGTAWYYFAANAVNLPLNNLVPPIFPLETQWEDLVSRIVPASLTAKMDACMEKPQAHFILPTLAVEETAGLGLGVSFLLLAVFAKKIRAGGFMHQRFWSAETLVPLGAWLALVVFMIKTGQAGSTRYLLPFFPVLAVPLMTGPVGDRFFRSRPWRGIGMVVFAVAALILVLSPARPLWPAETVLAHFGIENSADKSAQWMWNVYSTYRSRPDGFATVIAGLPTEANPIGFIGFDEPETALWRPFGSRQVRDICFADSSVDVKARGIKYALASERYFREHHNSTVDIWIERMNAKVVSTYDLKFLAGQPPGRWLLVEFQ